MKGHEGVEDIYRELRRKMGICDFGYPRTESGAECVMLKRFFTEEDAEYTIAFPDGECTSE